MDSKPSDQRFAWVDYAKGICIVAVVMLYATTDLAHEMERAGWPDGDARSWMELWVEFARPFRMPDFFLLSGLFLGRVIDRPWRAYLDTKVIHYLYFFVLWTVIFFVIRLALGIGDSSAAGGMRTLLTMLVQPFAMLWFIQMLAIYFVVTRLTRRVPVFVMLALAAGLQMLQYQSEWSQLHHFGARYVYFYVGYAFAPLFFSFADRVRSKPRVALICLVLWAAVNGWLVQRGLAASRGISLVLGLAGASAVIATAALLCKLHFMDGLRYLGQHSIVVYLGFYLPMSIGTSMYAQQRWLLDAGSAAALFSAASILLAMLLFWATRHSAARFLFVRPGWARLRLDQAPRAAIRTGGIASDHHR